MLRTSARLKGALGAGEATVHFLYIDEAGSTGADLTPTQQPVFVMAAVVVSDEKWRKTTQAVTSTLEDYFSAELPTGFELHACDLLSPNGDGPFAGHDRDARNELAQSLLSLVGERGHYVFHVPIYKRRLASVSAPTHDWGFSWHHPWQFAFSLQVTMFEDCLRSAATGATSTGLAIVDHEDGAVDFVRAHTALRQSEKGWRQLKKVVEIGYSAASHANPMIQLTDLVAFTLKKYYELQTANSASWPPEAKKFFEDCRNLIWARTKYKTLSFSKLNVHESVVAHAKEVKRP